MQQIIAITILSLLSLNLHAQDWPIVLQLKYSPFGTIDADEDEFNYSSDYDRYDMDFERSLGAKLIIAPVYISANQSITNLDEPIPDAKVETFAIGLGGINYDEFAYSSGLYLLGGVGIGAGHFKFEDPDQNEWETMVEANAEIGLRLKEHVLLGLGIDYQHFGEPGESKANYWNLYVGTGFTF